jgi:hypothetical protein
LESERAGAGNQRKDFMNLEQLTALKAVGDAIIETVSLAGPLGAPGGHIYAALMTHGATLEQYDQIMSDLVRAGKLRKRGDCYFLVRY